MRSDLGRLARVLLPWAGLVGLALAHDSARAPSIRIEQAWIRWLPAGVPAGGYLTLANTGDRAVILVGASSPIYEDVSLHRTQNRGGNIEMLPAERITVEAHATLDFAASGLHLMLMRPSRPVNPGDRVPITLRFADGSALTLSLEVRR